MPTPGLLVAQADEVLVRALASGSTVRGRVDTGSAREAVRLLTPRGWTDGQLAELLGRSRRQILRTRTALGLPAPGLGRNQRTQLVDAPTRPVSRG